MIGSKQDRNLPGQPRNPVAPYLTSGDPYGIFWASWGLRSFSPSVLSAARAISFMDQLDSVPVSFFDGFPVALAFKMLTAT